MTGLAYPPCLETHELECTPPGSLTRERYLEIKAALPFERDLRWVVPTIFTNQAFFASGLWLVQRGHLASFCVAQVVLAISYFQAFTLVHECGHGNCTKRRWTNAWLGHCLSPLAFMPYFVWQYEHARHHAWSGHKERDPTLAVLSEWHRTQHVPWLGRFAWRAWLPLAAAFQYLGSWMHPFTAYRNRPGRELSRALASVVWLLAVYTLVHQLWPLLFRLANFWPSLVVYLLGVELVNFPHHGGKPLFDRRLALWEQTQSVRSSYYPPGVSEVLMLNFNFHIEHHLFPSLPWYRLRRARALVKPALGSEYEETANVWWTIKRRFVSLPEVLQISMWSKGAVQPVHRDR